jgi:hypothetical protein
MDQQDLELEQSALEAFNINNDREPEHCEDGEQDGQED